MPQIQLHNAEAFSCLALIEEAAFKGTLGAESFLSLILASAWKRSDLQCSFVGSRLDLNLQTFERNKLAGCCNQVFVRARARVLPIRCDVKMNGEINEQPGEMGDLVCRPARSCVCLAGVLVGPHATGGPIADWLTVFVALKQVHRAAMIHNHILDGSSAQLSRRLIKWRPPWEVGPRGPRALSQNGR